jgi:hypothetical protein
MSSLSPSIRFRSMMAEEIYERGLTRLSLTMRIVKGTGK